MRHGKNPDVERALEKWFRLMINYGLKINGPMLFEKSKEFAVKLGHPDFHPTDGWLSRWKKRNEIVFRRAHGEKASANHEGASQWMDETIPQILDKFDPDDIFNADETGLYYRATPDGSLTYKYESLSGSKKALDRVTVLCCANMSGSEKKKLVVIGKSAKPRCFKGVNLKSLPVSYYSNSNAWMTSAIFTNWLQEWNKELADSNRKILLIVDNCTAHSPLSQFTNISLTFLPPNTTSLTQPMDMGVIKMLKTKYRSQLVRHVLSLLENQMPSSSTALQISAKVDLLTAIQMVADSWRQVSTRAIMNCFGKCGFRLLGTEEGGEAEVHDPSPAVTNLDQFINIDEKIECFSMCEPNFVDEVVQLIISEKSPAAQEKGSEDSDENEEEALPLSKKDAVHHLKKARFYFMQDGVDPGSCIENLNRCIDHITE